MKTKLFIISFGFLLFNAKVFAQIAIDYNQSNTQVKDSCDFTKGCTVKIINVPLNLTTAIVVNDQGTVNISISQAALSDPNKYKSAVTAGNGSQSIQMQIAGGKFSAPFTSGNISGSLAFQFNGKSVIIKPIQSTSITPKPGNPPIPGSQTSTVYIARYPYYDAQQLEKLFKGKMTTGNAATIKNILAAYGITVDNYKVNPFFTKNTHLDTAYNLNTIESTEGTLQSIYGSAANIDVTNLANGIAEFMIKRAKQELTIAFFNKFKNFANAHPEFKVLFPKTTDNLNTMLSYSYTEWLPGLRSGFYEDLQNMPSQADSVLKVSEVKTALQNYPALRVAIRTVGLADSIRKGKSVENALDKFAGFDEFNDPTNTSIAFNNFGNGVRLTNIFSKSLMDTTNSGTSQWISAKQLAALIQDADNQTILLGLIYQQTQTKSIQFQYIVKNKAGNDSTVTDKFIDIMKTLDKSITKFNNILPKFMAIARGVDSLKNDLESKKILQKAPSKEDYYNYVNSGLNILQYSFDIARQFDSHITSSYYIAIAKKADQVYLDISKEQYTQAAIDVIYILNKIDSGQSDKKITQVVTDVTKYGLFIANMINAQSPDDVESLVESAVLPAGSSSIKKNSDFNFAVQSYVGARYNVSSSSTNVNSAWSDQFGISAPIGLSVSYGFNKNAGAISLFGSIFDLGAIVDYQLTRDSVVSKSGSNTAATTKSYQVKLGQIISPGLFLVYGVGGNIPLSLGIGYQYGPGLSKINSDVSTVVTNPSGKLCAFLSVDIPLINLINISKKTNSPK